ncbi:glycosyltransferase family 62 protein [Tortispora caseinolytica NRRL Y-17796]|uniref:Glycosyltransferase family 62 protein n=1 Tax=Tortispora caseinolytica NRRL Y-17796 TaxID=767744 RepID=A0A1E4TM46_9ASCO|nr:glycosyltransferase family 62 protein [Tortispora caseinolytica NRRL Y-17796]
MMLPAYNSHKNGEKYGKPTSPFTELSKRTSFRGRLVVMTLCLVLFFVYVFPSTLPTGLLRLISGPALPESVRFFDLSRNVGSAEGWKRNERILMCVPLRDAAPVIPLFFSHLRNLTYPHHLIDLAFLVSDSKDNTMNLLLSHLEEIQADKNEAMHYGTIDVYEKDFGQAIGQGFSDRHGFAAQGPRRKLMARARNWLLSAALEPDHSWVYWRDADVDTCPPTILEDLMRHNKDVIVPNIWRPLPDWLGGMQPYDLNSWQESEAALQLADSLDEDAVIVEGYAEYATWRPHLAYLRDVNGDPNVEMDLDGIGGVSILAKARVFRAGAHFPAFSFLKHAETEGFGKMCRRMHFSVVGLPHYVVWHMYEPSTDDLERMKEMEKERIEREKEAQMKKLRAQRYKNSFHDLKDDWQVEKEMIFKNTEIDYDKADVMKDLDASSKAETLAQQAAKKPAIDDDEVEDEWVSFDADPRKKAAQEATLKRSKLNIVPVDSVAEDDTMNDKKAGNEGVL